MISREVEGMEDGGICDTSSFARLVIRPWCRCTCTV